ncbi:MAG TPA: farnesyl diphosphate synthase [bacterium]|nr:farnesyl diphosphate synthase [bacterium]
MPLTSRVPAGSFPLLPVGALAAIEARLAEHGGLVEATLDRSLVSADTPPQVVHRAMRYSVFAGGKRLRPILVLAGAEVAGMGPEGVLPAAAAVELIHTYSLIHDDLPAMDNSPTRRGRPTCHVVFGEAMAVLAGDALHALAFELLAGIGGGGAIPPDRVVAAIVEVTRGIGTQGMVGGQVLDLLASRGPVDAADVRQIHRLKTGSLIQACVRIGGMLAGASPDDLQALSRYGEHVGLAFQIVDDILDVVGEEVNLGKGTGSDAAQAKVTFPAVFGLDASRDLARAVTAQAISALQPLGARGEWLGSLAAFLLSRDR